MFIIRFIKGIWMCLVKLVLKWLGTITLSSYPPFVYINHEPYKVTARHIRACEKLIKPGDILLRRYDGSILSWFIPGRFSHSAIYIGDCTVIHALGDGVQKQDIIDFLRCDGYAVLRCNKTDAEELANEACKIAVSYLGYDYDYDFDICEDYDNKDEVQKRTASVYCHELTRSCYPHLNIPLIEPSIWCGAIKSKKKQFLAQSFLNSPDLTLLYDSDFWEPRNPSK